MPGGGPGLAGPLEDHRTAAETYKMAARRYALLSDKVAVVRQIHHPPRTDDVTDA